MTELQKAPHLSRIEEERLLRVAIQAAQSDFPNQVRLRCPGSAVLKAIAHRRVSFPTAAAIDHIATCSPCFGEYTRHRREHRVRVIGRLALTCAAGLCALAVLWQYGRSQSSPQKQPIAHESPNPTITAILDFRNFTTERSGGMQAPKSAEVSHLKRDLLNIAIKLPLGMEDGVYAVQFRTRLDQPVISTVGTAAWDGSAETLTTTIDLRTLAPGEYWITIRSGNASWRKYPVVLD